MRLRRGRLLSFAAFAILAGLLYWFASGRPSTRKEDRARPAPALELPDLKTGQPARLADLQGKVVLVDFWATWCEPCVDELPELVRLHRSLEQRGFTLLGVSLDSDPRDVKEFVRDNRVPYPILLAGGDPPPGWPLLGIPTAYLVDRRGLIIKRYLGPKVYDELLSDAEELLGR